MTLHIFPIFQANYQYHAKITACILRHIIFQLQNCRSAALIRVRAPLVPKDNNQMAWVVRRVRKNFKMIIALRAPYLENASAHSKKWRRFMTLKIVLWYCVSILVAYSRTHFIYISDSTEH